MVLRSLTTINIQVDTFIISTLKVSFLDEKYHSGIYKVGKNRWLHSTFN